MCTGWSSLKNKLFITLFQQKKQFKKTVVVRFHWWFQIWNLIVSLVNSSGEFDVYPFKVIEAALGYRDAFQRWPPSYMTCLKETLTQLNHWFLVVSSFGSPNKVLSQQNTASPGHGSSGSNNTTARIIVSLRIRLGGVLQIFPHHDVDMWRCV